MRERRNRNRVFVGTKVGFSYPGSVGGLQAKEIERECEKSLSRLQTDTIDLYYAHCDDRKTPLEEVPLAFNRLVETGKVRFIGASNWMAWRLSEARIMCQAHGWAPHAAIEQRYTYLRPKPGGRFDPQVSANDDLLDYCRASGITLLAYSILLNGAYTRPERPLPSQYVGADSNARLTVLRDVAQETGATPNQVIIAWMHRSDPPVLPIIGGSTPEQLTENISALALDLTAEQMKRLTQAGS